MLHLKNGLIRKYLIILALKYHLFTYLKVKLKSDIMIWDTYHLS